MKAYLYYAWESFERDFPWEQLKERVVDILFEELCCVEKCSLNDIKVKPATFRNQLDLYMKVVTPIDSTIWEQIAEISGRIKRRMQQALTEQQGRSETGAYDIRIDISEDDEVPQVRTGGAEKKGNGGRRTVEQRLEFDYKQRAKMFVSREPKYSFERAILSEAVMERIEDAESIMQFERKVFDEWGLYEIKPNPTAALNFYGPSGTGKTMAAEAFAQKLGKKILCVTYADVESKYHGEGPKMVKAIFEAAERDDAVLFFDEADSLLSKRLTKADSGSDYAVNSLRSQLLTCLEEFRGIVIFATNLVVNYDHAFLTRMISVEFTIPDAETRQKIWDSHIRPAGDGKPHRLNIPLGEDVDSAVLAQKYEFVGREIRDAVISACVAAARDERNIVSQKDFTNACDKIAREKERLAAAKDHTKDPMAKEAVKQVIIDKLKAGAADAAKTSET